MPLFIFSTRFVLLSALLAAMIAHALIVGSVGEVAAQAPTIRQNPLTVAATCTADEYATITYQGIVCAKPTDTWRNECTVSSECCNSGEFLKITPTGLQCVPFTNKASTYTTYCSDCCGASEFAVLTTLGLKCVGAGCTSNNDCQRPTPACQNTINRCVQCTQDNHCSFFSYCDTTDNKCRSCTWDNTYSCSGNRRVRYCKDNDVITKTQYRSCPIGQQCSNGSCTIQSRDGGWSNWGACSCTIRTSDSSTAGIQYRSCTNPQPSGSGASCSGSSSQSCTASGCPTGPSCSPANGGWETPPASSSVSCGTTWTAKCNNPTPYCGGAQCSGSAPTVTGTQCETGKTCSNGRCITSSCSSGQHLHGTTCENDHTWDPAPACPNTNNYACGTAIPAQYGTCNTPKHNCVGVRPINNCGTGTQCETGKTCSNGRCITSSCSSGQHLHGTTCENDHTWDPAPACPNTNNYACGTAIPAQYGTCNTPKHNCVGTQPINKCGKGTRSVHGGWSNTTWLAGCTCTSRTDDGNAGTQTGRRSCTNPTPACNGNNCTGSTIQTRSCTASGCAVDTVCQWQLIPCGDKKCGPQTAVCGPPDCVTSCTYSDRSTAQPGTTAEYPNRCGTCSGGDTCNTAGQCVACPDGQHDHGTTIVGLFTIKACENDHTWDPAPACPKAADIQCGATIPSQYGTCDDPKHDCIGTRPVNTCFGIGTKCGTGECIQTPSGYRCRISIQNPIPPTPASCPADTNPVSWTVGSNTCSGKRSLTASGSSDIVNNETTGFTGSATYSCNNGSWSTTPTSPSCTANAPGTSGCESTVIDGCKLSSTTESDPDYYSPRGQCDDCYSGTCGYRCVYDTDPQDVNAGFHYYWKKVTNACKSFENEVGQCGSNGTCAAGNYTLSRSYYCVSEGDDEYAVDDYFCQGRCGGTASESCGERIKNFCKYGCTSGGCDRPCSPNNRTCTNQTCGSGTDERNPTYTLCESTVVDYLTCSNDYCSQCCNPGSSATGCANNCNQ